jgi:hypothetical protein
MLKVLQNMSFVPGQSRLKGQLPSWSSTLAKLTVTMAVVGLALNIAKNDTSCVKLLWK